MSINQIKKKLQKFKPKSNVIVHRGDGHNLVSVRLKFYLAAAKANFPTRTFSH